MDPVARPAAGGRLHAPLRRGAARRAALRAVASAGAARLRGARRVDHPAARRPADDCGRPDRPGNHRRRRAAAARRRIDGRDDPPAEEPRHRAHRVRPRRHAGGTADARADHRASGAASRAGRARRGGRRSAGDLQQPAAHSRRADPDRGKERSLGRGHRDHPPPVFRCDQCRRLGVGNGEDRRHAGSESGAGAGRRPRAGGLRQSHRADRADRAQELRQLHLHAHGERLDPDDVAGTRARPGGHDAARAGSRRPDARHRQGAHADRDPEQAREADRCGIRGDADARRRRRRDPAAHAGDAGDRAGDRVRASPAARRHRLPFQGQPLRA